MDHFCETIHENNGVVKTMKKDYQIGKQEKSEQKIRDFKKISSKKDIFDGLIDLELYALYINKYLNIREIEDFKKLVKENSELLGK